MAGGHHALPSDPVERALARAHGILPDQGPIGVFVHHNTLHAFQHQPFFDGIEAGAALLGARPYLPLAAFRAAWRTGRIADADVRTEITRTLGEGARVVVAPGLSTAALWHTLMTADVHEDADDADGLAFAVDAGTAPESRDRDRWAACLARVVHHGPPPPAEPLPAPRRHRDVLVALGAGDTDVAVHAELVRLGAGFLDQGQAHTVLPARERGFLGAVAALYAAGAPAPRACRGVERDMARVAAGTLDARGAIDESLAALRELSGQAPINFAHRVLLVEGELQRVEGAADSALSSFERALTLASANDWVGDVAITHDLMARALATLGRADEAAEQRTAARNTYARWGVALSPAR